jgi:hypothetical protein
VSSDVDGTPSVFSTQADGTGARYYDTLPDTLPIRTDQSIWAFFQCPAGYSSLSKNLIHSSNSSKFIYGHGSTDGFNTVERPGMNFFVPGSGTEYGWVAVRWNGVSGTTQYVAKDTGPQASASGWAGLFGTWNHVLGTSGGSTQFHGSVKDLLLVNGVYLDGSTEHTKMLDYFKGRYPSLVSW